MKTKPFYFLSDFHFNYYFMIGGAFIGYLVYRIICSYLGNNLYIPTKFRSRRHLWRSIECNKSIPYNVCCTICGKLMLPGVGAFCECCAISACKRCCRAVNKNYRCKLYSWPEDKNFTHLWIDVGVLHHGDTGHDEEVIKRYFCSWCQRIKLSNDPTFNETERCDFKKYRKIIIPPTCVKLEKGAVSQIKPLLDKEWEPLIVFANCKSGSNRGDEVLSLFRGLLNPIQVVDLSTTCPKSVVRWLPPRCRLLVAGGDGTVAWLLTSLLSATHTRAAVGILPLGTGNDLSRVLGWGATCDSHLDAHSIIAAMMQADEQPLDRWKLTIKSTPGRLVRARPDRVLYAYNYASVGVDAQVTLDFHYARKQFLSRFASRTINYLAYAFLGVGRALDAGCCSGLERRLQVLVDEVWLPLPPLQALVVLNIPSWGAGCHLWNMGQEDVGEQSLDDGKLEVVGISSSFHIARLQCGLAEPYRFTQASTVKIVLEGSCAMQVDGEPWMQGPATIDIEHAGQVTALRAATPWLDPSPT